MVDKIQANRTKGAGIQTTAIKEDITLHPKLYWYKREEINPKQIISVNIENSL